jgi:pimeloyl-ACP methyl ester carboxylesterase
MITGGAGIRLHVIEAGIPTGKPLLFFHGFSQSALSWIRQLSSPLAETFRLIAVDLRGHGLSGKPREGYADSRLWADDVHALIKALDLDHPILCGWSYGPLVILDYLRHYGEDSIGGVNFVGGITKLGSDEALSVLTPEFLDLVPGLPLEDFLAGSRRKQPPGERLLTHSRPRRTEELEETSFSEEIEVGGIDMMVIAEPLSPIAGSAPTVLQPGQPPSIELCRAGGVCVTAAQNAVIRNCTREGC